MSIPGLWPDEEQPSSPPPPPKHSWLPALVILAILVAMAAHAIWFP